MSHIIYARICIVLTVGFAGLNVHQLLSPYEYVKGKIAELNDLVKDEGDIKGFNVVSMIFYFIVPAIYLFVLTKAEFIITGILILCSKFIISAALGLWTQKRIFTEIGYTKKIHLIGKVDNFLNIMASVAVAYLLIFPL